MGRRTSTKEKLLHAATREFLQSGFKNASLRSISAAAGVTTGAIYAYFADKDALFEAIVDPVCEGARVLFAEYGASCSLTDGMPAGEAAQTTLPNLHRIYNFIYDHFDCFRLLVVGADGSSKADFVHSIVEDEVARTLSFLDRLERQGRIGAKPPLAAIHIVSDSYVNGLLEPVRHGMSYEEAIGNLDFLGTFYLGGWNRVFGELLLKKG